MILPANAYGDCGRTEKHMLFGTNYVDFLVFGGYAGLVDLILCE